ncbi:uncharacterized protein LOC144623365 [Crassostrea virginica]
MGGIERPYVTSYSDRVTPYATRYALPRLDRDRWTSYQENEDLYRRNGSKITEDRIKETRKCLYIGIILLTVTLIVVITTLAVFVTMYVWTSENACFDDSSKLDLRTTNEIQTILTTSSDNVPETTPELLP